MPEILDKLNFILIGKMINIRKLSSVIGSLRLMKVQVTYMGSAFESSAIAGSDNYPFMLSIICRHNSQNFWANSKSNLKTF